MRIRDKTCSCGGMDSYSVSVVRELNMYNGIHKNTVFGGGKRKVYLLGRFFQVG